MLAWLSRVDHSHGIRTLDLYAIYRFANEHPLCRFASQVSVTKAKVEDQVDIVKGRADRLRIGKIASQPGHTVDGRPPRIAGHL